MGNELKWDFGPEIGFRSGRKSIFGPEIGFRSGRESVFGGEIPFSPVFHFIAYTETIKTNRKEI